MNTIFKYSFEKAASPRWIKELAKGKIKDVKKLLSHVPAKEREIKRLGSGSSQFADLVAHPKHGISVRKIPSIRSTTSPYMQSHLDEAEDTIGLMTHLKEISKGKGNIAHIKGNEGLVGYYNYSKPSLSDLGARIEKKRMEMHAKRKFLNTTRVKEIRRAYKSPNTVPPGKIEKIQAKHDRVNEAYYRMREINNRPSRAIDKETRKYLEEAKKKYPEMFDYVERNTVGGKIVDISPSRSYGVRMNDGLKNPEAYSRSQIPNLKKK